MNDCDKMLLYYGDSLFNAESSSEGRQSTQHRIAESKVIPVINSLEPTGDKQKMAGSDVTNDDYIAHADQQAVGTNINIKPSESNTETFEDKRQTCGHKHNKVKFEKIFDIIEHEVVATTPPECVAAPTDVPGNPREKRYRHCRMKNLQNGAIKPDSKITFGEEYNIFQTQTGNIYRKHRRKAKTKTVKPIVIKQVSGDTYTVCVDKLSSTSVKNKQTKHKKVGNRQTNLKNKLIVKIPRQTNLKNKLIKSPVKIESGYEPMVVTETKHIDCAVIDDKNKQSKHKNVGNTRTNLKNELMVKSSVKVESGNEPMVVTETKHIDCAVIDDKRLVIASVPNIDEPGINELQKTQKHLPPQHVRKHRKRVNGVTVDWRKKPRGKRKPPPPEVMKEREQKRTCQFCGMLLPTPTHRTIHERVHTGEKPYTCGVCRKSYKSCSDLGVHIRRVHTVGNTVPCSVCESKFSTKASLAIHMRIHTGFKPYSCGVCDKAFHQSGHLLYHIRIHTGDKPYNCSACDQSFAQKPHLDRHYRTHTGERPYKCDICDKSFAQKSHLIVHTLIHTGEQPLTCYICQRSFALKNSLRVHLLTHSDDRPFECEYCGKRFKHNGYLSKHIQLHKSGTLFPKIRDTIMT